MPIVQSRRPRRGLHFGGGGLAGFLRVGAVVDQDRHAEGGDGGDLVRPNLAGDEDGIIEPLHRRSLAAPPRNGEGNRTKCGGGGPRLKRHLGGGAPPPPPLVPPPPPRGGRGEGGATAPHPPPPSFFFGGARAGPAPPTGPPPP